MSPVLEATVEEIMQIPHAARVVAGPEWEDENGHVNVTHFYGFHLMAATASLDRIGLGERYRSERGLSVFSMEQHLRFFSEVLVGEDISAHVRWLDRGDKVFHGLSIVVNHSTGRIANTFEMLEGHVDLTTRRSAPFPPDVAELLDGEIAAHRALPWQLPLSGAIAVRR